MTKSIYSEKEIFGDALEAAKTCTEHYNTFSNECIHSDVRNTLLNILGQEHEIQNTVFQMMHQKGFYPVPDAQESKIQETKMQFSKNLTN